MDHSIAKIRHDYQLNGLSEGDLLPDPLSQFRRWFEEVLAAGISEPNAMLLSTVSHKRPSARVVLLKDLDDRGFSFFTNYGSRKGFEISENPGVALTFFWKELERQVRIEGVATKVTEAESAGYFAVRPRGSQIGAWASEQSAAIPDRGFLEEKTQALEERFEGAEVPRPEFWGGYRVIPDYMEFWQGRPSRLHDRLAYIKQADGSWKIERLSP